MLHQLRSAEDKETGGRPAEEVKGDKPRSQEFHLYQEEFIECTLPLITELQRVPPLLKRFTTATGARARAVAPRH